jgi:hypothetical protein
MEAPHIVAASSVLAGQYMVRMANCNGCHTPGWHESDGKVPLAKWLTGSNVGYRGPWGTVYPVNVRLFAAGISRADWIALFQAAPAVPVMPFEDYGHGAMAASDLGAIYDFVTSLGKAGKPAPTDLAPGKTPKTPYVYLMPTWGASGGGTAR